MIELLAATICVAILAVLMARFPAFRIAIVILGFLASAIVWWIIDQNQERRALAHELIPLEQVDLKDLSVLKDNSGYLLTGIVGNQSPKYILTELIVKVLITDCPDASVENRECEIIGNTIARAHSPWMVPPSQTRDIRVGFELADLPEARGVVRWNYSVVQTRARLEP